MTHKKKKKKIKQEQDGTSLEDGIQELEDSVPEKKKKKKKKHSEIME